MTEAEQKELREAKEAATAATAESRKLKERFATIDASTALSGYFRTIRVGQGVQERVTNRILAGSLPLTEAGELDTKKLTEFAEAAVKDELDYLKRLNPGLVRGMTAPGVTVQATEAQQKEAKKANKKAVKEADRQFANVMGFGSDMHKIGRRILREGRGQFDVNYNARHKGAVLPGAGETMQVGG